MTDPIDVRIALVMNGGVSLAVWMGGVTQEIDLLRRASLRKLQPDPQDPDTPVYRKWAEVCTELGVKVTVDLVAGTSAGGLNGTLLATAIARGAPLPQLHQVWHDVAQLDHAHLLRPPDASEDSSGSASSVLSGKFFHDQVLQVFSGIGRDQPDDQTCPQDVTLFVTSTAIGPQPRTIIDSDGLPLTVQDHRRLYKFPRSAQLVYQPARQGVSEASFEPVSTSADWCDNSPLLAQVAQASASFPVAFPSVPEHVVVQGGAARLSDFRVIGTDDAWLMDGGVLDNAPFGPVLDEIGRMPADTPRRRALVYVVPSVDASRQVSQGAEAPGWQHVLASALMLPREADLRDDVDELARLAQAADRWASGPLQLFTDLRGDPALRSKCRTVARTLFSRYRASRTEGGINDAFSIWAQHGLDARVSMSRLTTPEDIDPVGWVPGSLSEIGLGDSWTWGTAVADRTLRLMLRELASRPSNERSNKAMSLLSAQLLRVAAVRDEVVAFVAQREPRSPARPTTADAVDAVNAATRSLDVPAALADIVQTGAAAYVDASSSPQDVATAVTDALVVELVTGAFAADQTFVRPVAFDFFRFGPDIDSPGITIVDPRDANQELPLGPWKLWGTHLGHFAAFGESGWRDADWLWGRLDGVAHLVRLLAAEADPEVRRGFNLDAAIAELQALVLVANDSSIAKVTDAANELAPLDNDDVVAIWSRTDKGLASLLDVLESALRTMRDRRNGNNGTIAALGDILTIALARDLPRELRDSLGEKVLRHLADFSHVREHLVQHLRRGGQASAEGD